MKRNAAFHSAALAGLVAGALLPSFAMAQAQPAGEKWEYAAAIYGYLPKVDGTTTFPVPAGGSNISVDSSKIITGLQGAFMGGFGAHNGRWGAFTDVVYVNVSASKAGTRDFSIGNGGIPAATSADINLGVSALIWTMAGQYRVKSDSALTVDLLAGTRMADFKHNLGWSITGNLGPLAAPGRSGSREVKETNWDAIIGVKGRYRFGAESAWSMPFYVDVGTGESDRTTQAAIGVAYAFQWGELAAMWRYLDYNMKSSSQIQSVNFSGPMVGAAWRW